MANLKDKEVTQGKKPSDEGMEEDDENSKEVREIINACNELIIDLESDLSILRGIRKRSKHNKEVRKLIHKCNDLIKGIESD